MEGACCAQLVADFPCDAQCLLQGIGGTRVVTDQAPYISQSAEGEGLPPPVGGHAAKAECLVQRFFGARIVGGLSSQVS
jgi:hypothetical protein